MSGGTLAKRGALSGAVKPGPGSRSTADDKDEIGEPRAVAAWARNIISPG